MWVSRSLVDTVGRALTSTFSKSRMEMTGVCTWEALPVSAREASVAGKAAGSPGEQGQNISLPLIVSRLHQPIKVYQ